MKRCVPFFLLLPTVSLLACGEDPECPACDTLASQDTTDTGDPVDTSGPADDTDTEPDDLDGDGWAWPEDCNDNNPAVHPDALDIQDGADNNCDGSIDVHTLAAAHTKLIGEDAGDWAGANVAGVGDVNADGFDDIGVAAWYNDASATDAGAVYVLFGPVEAGSYSLSYADVRLTGENAGDTLSRLIGVGDHDGDGYDDVVFCAQNEDSGGSNAGAAYLMTGPLEGPWDIAEAEAKLIGEAAGDGVMRAVRAGDLDADGQDDLLIGAPGDKTYGTNTGAAYIVLGQVSGSVSLTDSHAKLHGIAEGDLAGAFMVGPGDLNGDGYDDAVIGDHNGSHGGDNTGSAYLLYGPVSDGTRRLTQAADAMFFGARANGKAGKVAWAGDLTGDGAQDWVTAMFGDEGGDTFVFEGIQNGELGPADADVTLSLGVDDATGVGDVNGDGNDDLLVGSSGESYLVFGPLLSDVVAGEADVVFPGERDDDYAGWRVASVGDTDADGYQDFMIGAKAEDTGGQTAGAAYLVLGSP